MEETKVVPIGFIHRTEGLIDSFPYKYKEDGSIDWRAMVPTKYLYPNPTKKEQIEKKYNKSYDQINVVDDNVADTDLVITLPGIKYLLRIRGCSKVDFDIKTASQEYAGVKCSITFIPNKETEGREIVYSDAACAHFNNTKSFTQQYLLEMACNRAFCRVIRNFLNIDIVSREELGSENSFETNMDLGPASSVLIEDLKARMVKHGYTFDQIKAKIVVEEPAAANWSKIEDMPSKWLIKCIERIETRQKKIQKKS